MIKESVLKVSIILTYKVSRNSYLFNNTNRCNNTIIINNNNKIVTYMEAEED